MTGAVAAIGGVGLIDYTLLVGEDIVGDPAATGLGSGSIFGSGAASNYEAYATLLTGTVNTGTFGGWLDLSNPNLWEKSTPFGASASFQVDVRDKWTLAVVRTVTYILTVG